MVEKHLSLILRIEVDEKRWLQKRIYDGWLGEHWSCDGDGGRKLLKESEVYIASPVLIFELWLTYCGFFRCNRYTQGVSVRVQQPICNGNLNVARGEYACLVTVSCPGWAGGLLALTNGWGNIILGKRYNWLQVYPNPIVLSSRARTLVPIYCTLRSALHHSTRRSLRSR